MCTHSRQAAGLWDLTISQCLQAVSVALCGLADLRSKFADWHAMVLPACEVMRGSAEGNAADAGCLGATTR